MLSMETEELRKQIEDPNNNIMELTHNSELNSPIPVHFSSLIPRMSTFTLAISFEHFQFALIRGPVFLQITFLNDVCYMFGLHRGTVEETTDSIHYHVY